MKTTKNKKIVFGLLALTGAYLVYRYFRRAQPTIGNSTSAADTKDGAKEDLTGSKYIYPLKRGSRGKAVEQLQLALGGKKNLPKFGIDGNYGSETEMAVQKFLGKKTVDGFEEVLKIANLNNLAYDSVKKTFYSPKGGVTSRITDIQKIK
jgi:peptidoglycan hydrolase-like protein with peptidoglycan-binding domain